MLNELINFVQEPSEDNASGPFFEKLAGPDRAWSLVLAHNRVAAPRSAASVHGVGHGGDCVVAAVARYNTIETASAGSKVLQNGR